MIGNGYGKRWWWRRWGCRGGNRVGNVKGYNARFEFERERERERESLCMFKIMKGYEWFLYVIKFIYNVAIL